MMEQVRWCDMKRTKFINMAWQMYVDAVIKNAAEFITADVPTAMGRTPRTQHGGSLETAIRSQMPGLEAKELAAEEIVDAILRIEVIEGRLPIEVCSPVHHPAWDEHQSVACGEIYFGHRLI